MEGDASSASYFLAAGAIGKGPVRVEGVGKLSIQGDVRFAEALRTMGAKITMGDNWIEAQAGSGNCKAIDLDCNHIPDAAMTLAVAALFADGTTILRNIASWRVKETDRIAAMATELRKLGATVEEGADFIRVTPPATLIPNASIDTYDDHRMAMCFSLAVWAACRSHQRSEMRGQDLSRIISSASDERSSQCSRDPHHRHRRPFGLRQGHGRPTGGQAARLSLSGFSGALYRLVALAAQAGGRCPGGRASAGRAGGRHSTSASRTAKFTLDSQQVSEAVRSEEMSRGASEVAVLRRCDGPCCSLQRAFRKAPGLVADGRDMGISGISGRHAQGVSDRERRGTGGAPL